MVKSNINRQLKTTTKPPLKKREVRDMIIRKGHKVICKVEGCYNYAQRIIGNDTPLCIKHFKKEKEVLRSLGLSG